MSKARVFEVIRAFALEGPSETEIEREYQKIVLDLQVFTFATQVTVLDVAAEQALFQLPEQTIRIDQVMFDGRMLAKAMPGEIEQASGGTWRYAVGTPRYWLEEEERATVFRLFPAPRFETQWPFVPIYDPLGDGLPRNGLVVFHTVIAEPLNDQLDSYLAFRTLARLYGADDSAYRDPMFAGMCAQLAERQLRQLNEANSRQR